MDILQVAKASYIFFIFLKYNSAIKKLYNFFFITSVSEITIAQISSWHKLPYFDFIRFYVISFPCQYD